MPAEKLLPISVLFAATEMWPLVESTSAAILTGCLPVALKALNIDIRIILPAYPEVLAAYTNIRQVAHIRLHGCDQMVRVLQTVTAEGLILYLIDMPDFFSRHEHPYVDREGNEWLDNAQRFYCFCQTIVSLSLDQLGLAWRPDVVHCQDWATSLIPALLSKEDSRPSTVLSIGQLNQRGIYDYSTFASLHFDSRWWSHDLMEHNDRFSFLQGGIAFADQIVTQSETFAAELMDAQHNDFSIAFACRKFCITGILGGWNEAVWNPMKDTSLLQNYNKDGVEFKQRNKTVLQEQVGLEVDESVLLLGFYATSDDLQDMALIVGVLPYLMKLYDVQLLLVCDELMMQQTPITQHDAFAGRVVIMPKNTLLPETRVVSGCDVMLMPAMQNSDGLIAMQCFRYGTVPLARATGGLKQLIVNCSPKNQLNASANGFLFEKLEADELWGAIQRAYEQFRRPGVWWEKLVMAGMRRRCDWSVTAASYKAVYQQAMEHPAPNPLAKGR